MLFGPSLLLGAVLQSVAAAAPARSCAPVTVVALALVTEIESRRLVVARPAVHCSLAGRFVR
jgi:hypothetical protein